MLHWLHLTVVLATTVLLSMLCGAALLSQTKASEASSYGVVRIQAFNPYGFDLKAEVKCDHDYKTNRFRFHRFYLVRAKSNITVEVPNTMRNCQLWPKVVLF